MAHVVEERKILRSALGRLAQLTPLDSGRPPPGLTLYGNLLLPTPVAADVCFALHERVPSESKTSSA